MFSICDKDGSESISLQEFTETMGKLMKQSDKEEEMEKINREKLHFLFKIYDEDSELIVSQQFLAREKLAAIDPVIIPYMVVSTRFITIHK